MTRHSVRTPDQLRSVLRKLRSSKDLSQTEFGRRIGLSQERISAIENHPERVTVDQLLTILMALEAELVIAPRGTPGVSAESW